jgi:hypothetical protein
MARTTIDLDPAVLDELRRRGRREHKSIGQLASEMLAQSLAEKSGADVPAALTWISRDLGKPRVDLDDKQALSALLDQPN